MQKRKQRGIPRIVSASSSYHSLLLVDFYVDIQPTDMCVCLYQTNLQCARLNQEKEKERKKDGEAFGHHHHGMGEG